MRSRGEVGSWTDSWFSRSSQSTEATEAIETKGLGEGDAEARESGLDLGLGPCQS